MKGGIGLRRKNSMVIATINYFYQLRLQGENGKTRLIPKNVKASIQNQKVARFDSDRKQFNLIPNISFRCLYNL